MPRLLGDFRGIPTALSLGLFVQGTRCVCCVWVLFPFLSVAARVLMETRIPGGPHIKTRGIAALAFQTNITHFLCCLRDRGHDGLSPEDLPPPPPPYPLHATHTPPSTPSRYHLPSSLPPHPTGAAKSKCQSRSGRCIPSGAPLLVATDGSAAWFQLYDNPLWWPINYPIGLEMRHLSTSLSLSPSPLFSLSFSPSLSPSFSLLLSLSFSASEHADTSVHCDLFCPDLRHAAYESHWSVPAKVGGGGRGGRAAPPPPGQVAPSLLPSLGCSCLAGDGFFSSFFYEGDLNMPVLIGLDSPLRLQESSVHSDGRRSAHLYVFPFTSRRQLFEVRPLRPSSHPLLWIPADFTVTSLRKTGNNKAVTHCRRCAKKVIIEKKTETDQLWVQLRQMRFSVAWA